MTISPERLARIAGVLYLTVAVFGGAPQLLVRPSVRVAGDPTATAGAIAANETLLRAAFVGELVAITSFLLLVMTLFMLLKHVNRYVAAAMATFVTVSVAILSVNMINHLAAVMLATDPTFAVSVGADGSAALALMFLELHEIGYSIAEVFFGLWLLPLGYLAYRSGYFPKALGVLLMVGCFAYLVLALAVPLFGGVPEMAVWVIAAPAGAAEFWMIGYLLIKGIRAPTNDLAVASAA